MYEKHLLTVVGIDPQTYYSDTIRNNFKRAQAWENNASEEWKRTRFLAYTIIDYTYAGMGGEKVNKKYKRSEDLFPLPTDIPEKVMSDVDANKLMEQLIIK